AGCTFQHLLTRPDQEAALARVYEHLAPGGRFVIEVIFPHPRLLTTVEEEQAWFSYEDGQGQEVRVSGTERYDHVGQIKHETAVRRWYNAGEKWWQPGNRRWHCATSFPRNWRRSFTITVLRYATAMAIGISDR
ncbi:MAG TPA: class I SAM-dependent methyltransferase, partial [Anaerolineae bacterium]